MLDIKYTHTLIFLHFVKSMVNKINMEYMLELNKKLFYALNIF